MPTGYTAKLVENGQSFPEFVMGCARAFGALIEMRDESADAPIPHEFKPSTYHADRLTEIRTELLRLQDMGNDERIAFGRAAKEEDIARNREYIRKTEEENARLAEMESQVKAWEPPTSEHQELKKFMLQQLFISKSITEYSQKGLATVLAKSPGTYYSDAVLSAENSISYHTEHLEDDVVRAKDRTNWVKQLRESLAVTR